MSTPLKNKFKIVEKYITPNQNTNQCRTFLTPKRVSHLLPFCAKNLANLTFCFQLNSEMHFDKTEQSNDEKFA